MPATRKVFILLGSLVLISAALIAGDKKPKPKNSDAATQAASPMDRAQPAAQMDNDKRIVHALNRFTFGVRPGDVDRVRAMGLDKWLDEQLNPDKINDSAVESRLAPLRTLKMSTREMIENFPPPQVLKAVENGRMSMPSDPAKRAIYESRIVAYQQQQQQKKDGKDDGAFGDKAANDANAMADLKPDPNDRGSALTPEQRQKMREDAMYADLGANKKDAAGKAPTSPASNDKTAAQSDAKMDMEASSPVAAAAAQNKNKGKNGLRGEARMYANLNGEGLLQLPPDDRYKAILKMSPEDRLDLARAYRGPRGMQLVEGMKPEQQETVEAIVNPQVVVGGELSQAKLLRDIYSERQLDEVMADFWFNHFNVFIGKGPDRYMLTTYERDVIRPHALGKFKDLLAATSKSPAMLFYLDNWESVGPNSDLAQGKGRRGRYARFPRPQQVNKNRPSGLNENYAREIMELHTLGVEGGYTQKDVTELAKVLTGWSIDQPRTGGSYRFNERAHEPGPKYVLGHKISEHGESEGSEMLDILAHHPSTAKFISRKLAMRFVSDDPSPSLVARMADTFLKKDGDIREVLRTMFHSPEFWAADAYRAKLKTPLEFVVSAVRASGADVQNAQPLVGQLNRMGMPLYGMQPPTGYSMKADAWVNSSALLNRMNFALMLGSGRQPGTSLDPQALLRDPTPMDSDGALAALESGILAGDVSTQTHAVMQRQLSDPKIAQRSLDDPEKKPNYGAIAGLIMGSPEFQRR